LKTRPGSPSTETCTGCPTRNATGLNFGHRHDRAHDREVHQGDDRPVPRTGYCGCGRHKSAGVNEACRDDTVEWRHNPAESNQRLRSLNGGLRDRDFCLGGVEGAGRDQVRRFGAGRTHTLEISRCQTQFRSLPGQFGLKFRDGELRQSRAGLDAAAAVDGDAFDLTSHLGEKRHLLDSRGANQGGEQIGLCRRGSAWRGALQAPRRRPRSPTKR
jgi:hypothetical protein